MTGVTTTGCILGLDFGTKRVGAAVSDSRRMIATPLEVYERRDPTQDARHYQALVREHDVERIVIGLPVHLGGREGTSASLARTWGDWLGEGDRPGRRLLRRALHDVRGRGEPDRRRMKRSKRKGLRDMLAARLLLQNYLDAGCPESTATPRAALRPGGGRPLTTLIVGCGYLGRRVGRPAGEPWRDGLRHRADRRSGRGTRPNWESSR